MIGIVPELVVPPVIPVSASELNPEEVEVTGLAQVLQWRRECALDVVPVTSGRNHRVATECGHGNKISHPISEDNFSWNWLRTVIGIELDVEVITLHQSIDSKAFIDWIRVAFGGDHERDLTGLEVEIHGRVSNHCGVGGIVSIVTATLSLYVAVKITLGYSVGRHVGQRQVRSDFNDQLTKCEHVGLREVIPKTQSKLERSSLSNWQFDGLDHWMYVHLPDVPSSGINRN